MDVAGRQGPDWSWHRIADRLFLEAVAAVIVGKEDHARKVKIFTRPGT